MDVIIVTKVHDDLDLNRCKANVEITGNGKKIHRNRIKIRPLPETKDVGYPNEDYDVGFGDGWNACIDEITGETE